MPQTRRRQSSSTKSNNNSQTETQQKQDEADRYRRAAEDALQQLDWAIGYLHGIKKTDISRALARNRSFIRRELMGQPEEPVPSQQTNET
jgi:hypothetical protein